MLDIQLIEAVEEVQDEVLDEDIKLVKLKMKPLKTKRLVHPSSMNKRNEDTLIFKLTPTNRVTVTWGDFNSEVIGPSFKWDEEVEYDQVPVFSALKILMFVSAELAKLKSFQRVKALTDKTRRYLFLEVLKGIDDLKETASGTNPLHNMNLLVMDITRGVSVRINEEAEGKRYKDIELGLMSAKTEAGKVRDLKIITVHLLYKFLFGQMGEGVPKKKEFIIKN